MVCVLAYIYSIYGTSQLHNTHTHTHTHPPPPHTPTHPPTHTHTHAHTHRNHHFWKYGCTQLCAHGVYKTLGTPGHTNTHSTLRTLTGRLGSKHNYHSAIARPPSPPSAAVRYVAGCFSVPFPLHSAPQWDTPYLASWERAWEAVFFGTSLRNIQRLTGWLAA